MGGAGESARSCATCDRILRTIDSCSARLLVADPGRRERVAGADEGLPPLRVPLPPRPAAASGGGEGLTLATTGDDAAAAADHGLLVLLA